MQASSKKPQSRIKHIQTEHFAKLTLKQNNETELLEDMRSFCKQRAVLEKEYGQSLQKLCSSFLNKKEFLAIQNPPSVGYRSVWDIWKSYLREFNALALSHLKSAEIHHRLSLDLKPVKSVRVGVSKRILEQLKSLQNDLAASVQEMVKSQKIYSEEEKQARDTRVKAMNIEEKLRRRSTNLFNTMAQLHRNHAKLSQRRDECENRSAGARNEYLFQLTAINAHLEHYLKTDIPDLALILDGDVYDRFREVLSKTSETELEICRHHQDSFRILLEESAKVNRTTAWENFIKESPIFSEDVEFQFEPRDGDKICTLFPVNAKEGSFEQVAKKLARHFVTRERRIKSYREEISALCSSLINPTPGIALPLSQQAQTPMRKTSKEYEAVDESGVLNQEYVENKVEELEFAIRREEIEKAKISACLELLKKTQVDVEGALEEANKAAIAEAAAAAASASELSGVGIIGLSLSVGGVQGPSSSSTAATGSSSTEGSTVGLLLADAFGGPISRSQNGGVSRATAQQLANDAWARATSSSTGTTTTGTNREPSFIHLDDDDNGNDDSPKSKREPSPEVDWTEGGRLPKAKAMYEFLATRTDEINMVLNERVVLLGSGDGEDWVKVRSLLDGKEGFVPRAFLSIDPTPPPAPPHPVVASMANMRAPKAEAPPPPVPPPPPPPPSDLSSPHPPMEQCLAGQFVRALVAFTGSAADELSFGVDDVIHVLGRPAAGAVDDGWIEGELVPPVATSSGAPARGVFPSMLVEPVPAEETWRRRLSACRKGNRPQSTKTLLTAEHSVDGRASPGDERRREPLNSSGSLGHSRSNTSVSRSKSRTTSSSRQSGSSQRRTHTNSTSAEHNSHTISNAASSASAAHHRSLSRQRHRHPSYHSQQQQQQKRSDSEPATPDNTVNVGEAQERALASSPAVKTAPVTDPGEASIASNDVSPSYVNIEQVLHHRAEQNGGRPRGEETRITHLEVDEELQIAEL